MPRGRPPRAPLRHESVSLAGFPGATTPAAAPAFRPRKVLAIRRATHVMFGTFTGEGKIS
jgi:hypothetical protein